MSRIGVRSIDIPKDVKIERDNSGNVTVSGVLGSLVVKIPDFINIKIEENLVYLSANSSNKKNFWGLSRSLLNNAVYGVNTGYSVRVKLVGVGYKALLEKDTLILFLGYSHPIFVLIPKNVTIVLTDATNFLVKSVDKQLVTTMANRIRLLRSPEPYKGKGIIVNDEFILRKEGKR